MLLYWLLIKRSTTATTILCASASQFKADSAVAASHFLATSHQRSLPLPATGMCLTSLFPSLLLLCTATVPSSISIGGRVQRFSYLRLPIAQKSGLPRSLPPRSASVTNCPGTESQPILAFHVDLPLLPGLASTAQSCALIDHSFLLFALEGAYYRRLPHLPLCYRLLTQCHTAGSVNITLLYSLYRYPLGFGTIVQMRRVQD